MDRIKKGDIVKVRIDYANAVPTNHHYGEVLDVKVVDGVDMIQLMSDLEFGPFSIAWRLARCYIKIGTVDTVRIAIDGKERNKDEFIKMMAWIELCGNIGHTCQWFRVGVDGDGSGSLRFKFDNEMDQNRYDNIKQELLVDYQKNGDLKEISFE